MINTVKHHFLYKYAENSDYTAFMQKNRPNIHVLTRLYIGVWRRLPFETFLQRYKRTNWKHWYNHSKLLIDMKVSKKLPLNDNVNQCMNEWK